MASEVYKGWTIRQEGGYTEAYPPKGSKQPPLMAASIEQAKRVIDRRAAGEATGYQKVVDAKANEAKRARLHRALDAVMDSRGAK